MRAIWPAAALTAVLGLLHGVGARELFFPAVRVEAAAFDLHYTWRSRLKPAPPPDSRLLLLAYDEQTRELESGRASAYHIVAEAMEKLADAKARMVFIDYRLDTSRFSDLGKRIEEARRALPADSPPEALHTLGEISAELRVDQRLAAAMRRVPTVMIFGCSNSFDPTGAVIDPLVLAKARPIHEAEPPANVRRIGRIVPPSRVFVESATAIAGSCEFPGPDGVVRSDPSIVAVRDGAGWSYLPSASVMLAAEALGLPEEALAVERNGLRFGNKLIPAGHAGDTILGLSGPGGSFRGQQGKPARHTIAELINGEIPASRLEGRIVLMGDTLAASRDLKVTPFGYGIRERMPGVEKIAMHTSYLMQTDEFLSRPLWARYFGFLLTILLGIVAAFAGARLGFYSALSLLGLAPVIFLAGTAALTFGDVWIDTAFPAIAWAVGVGTAASVRYAQEARERRSLEFAFERYVPREMVKAILRDPSTAKLMGEERQMTVLFADLRGFTTYSEGHTPKEVVAHLNEHLSLMSDVIQKHGGTVDKFIGDAVMAFWGAPLPDKDHAAHACQAAQEMLTALDRQNEERIVRGLPLVDMGIGINSGPMIVGNMGSTKRFNYTVIGDAVNLASRLETITKEFHRRIVVGGETVKLAQKYFAFVALGEVTVKGKQDRVPIFSLEESASAAATSSAPAPARPAKPTARPPSAPPAPRR